MASGGGSEEEFRWLASENMNTYGAKDGEICRRSTVAVVVTGFFSGKAAGLSAEQIMLNHGSLPLRGCY